MSFELDLNELGYTPEREETGDGIPRISWLSTTKTKGVVGKFYARETALPSLLAPWTHDELFDDEAGFTATDLRIIVLRTRTQAYSEETNNGIRTKTWHTHWKANAGMRLYTEILCFIEGYDDVVVWPVKGLVGRGVTAARGESIFSAMREVEKEARKTANRDIPSFMFWTPITQPKDKKGRVVTIDTGYGSNVVIPQVGFDVSAINRDLCASLYVGKERMALAAEAFAEYKDWSKEVRSNDEAEAPAPTEPARNVATAIDEDDVKPF
jgi:hypothetical protein